MFFSNLLGKNRSCEAWLRICEKSVPIKLWSTTFPNSATDQQKYVFADRCLGAKITTCFLGPWEQTEPFKNWQKYWIRWIAYVWHPVSWKLFFVLARGLYFWSEKTRTITNHESCHYCNDYLHTKNRIGTCTGYKHYCDQRRNGQKNFVGCGVRTSNLALHVTWRFSK